MSKILLPTIDYPPARGGVARYIGAIVKTYPEQVTLLPLRKKMKTGDLILRLLFKAQGYDAIWTHHALPIGTAAMLVKKLIKKPYVVFLHGLDFDLARRNAWKRYLLKAVLTNADRVVTNSEALATEVRGFLQSYQTPLVVYPTLQDEFIEAVKSSSSGEKINLQKLGELAVGVARSETPMIVTTSQAGQGPLRLLTVARLVERKGHLKVIQAVQQNPDLTYHIVGDGPLLKGLQTMVRSFGLEDRIKFTTDASDEQLPEIYRSADIFVMPTYKSELDREGFGIVYLEAQLFGLPVIATRHPGVDEAIRDGEGGLLIGETPEDLAAAINRLKDPDIRRKFGARGRAWVEHEFNREQQMYKLRELL